MPHLAAQRLALALCAVAGCEIGDAAPRLLAGLRLDPEGRLRGGGLVVGVVDPAGAGWLTVGADGRPVPMADAAVGVLRAEVGNPRAPQVVVRARPAAGVDGPLAALLEDGRRLGGLDGGSLVLDDEAPLGDDDGTRLEAAGGAWAAVALRRDAEDEPRLRWVQPAYAPAEVAERARQLDAAAAQLPSEWAERVQPVLPIMALVSVIEGRFGDGADAVGHDPSASLGIFQWATRRRDPVDTDSTLGRFFARLKRRARRSGADPLLKTAWKEARSAGLDVGGRQLLLDGRAATGGEVEERLQAPMAGGALRRYQLIAAQDWIEDVRGTLVRPGVCGRTDHVAGPLSGWPRYAEAESGRLVTFTHGGITVALHARQPLTVAEVLRAPAALATAVNLGVNRPRFVECALWRGLVPEDAPVRIAALVARIAAGQTPGARVEAEALPERAVEFAELAQLVWPSLGGLDDAQLLAAFRRHALELYRSSERERRARRLVSLP